MVQAPRRIELVDGGVPVERLVVVDVPRVSAGRSELVVRGVGTQRGCGAVERVDVRREPVGVQDWVGSDAPEREVVHFGRGRRARRGSEPEDPERQSNCRSYRADRHCGRARSERAAGARAGRWQRTSRAERAESVLWSWGWASRAVDGIGEEAG